MPLEEFLIYQYMSFSFVMIYWLMLWFEEIPRNNFGGVFALSVSCGILSLASNPVVNMPKDQAYLAACGIALVVAVNVIVIWVRKVETATWLLGSWKLEFFKLGYEPDPLGLSRIVIEPLIKHGVICLCIITAFIVDVAFIEFNLLHSFIMLLIVLMSISMFVMKRLIEHDRKRLKKLKKELQQGEGFEIE